MIEHFFLVYQKLMSVVQPLCAARDGSTGSVQTRYREKLELFVMKPLILWHALLDGAKDPYRSNCWTTSEGYGS